jgi:hypothetical protein
MDHWLHHDKFEAGLPYEDGDKALKRNTGQSTAERKKTVRNEDGLIIEDNTVYEIDPECYEKLKKQKKKR